VANARTVASTHVHYLDGDGLRLQQFAMGHVWTVPAVQEESDYQRSALTYRATVDVPARFRNSKAVGAVLGLTPSNRARSTEPAQSHGAETR
jgi:hypothetical protein